MSYLIFSQFVSVNSPQIRKLLPWQLPALAPSKHLWSYRWGESVFGGLLLWCCAGCAQSVSLCISRLNKDPQWKLPQALEPQVFLSFSSLQTPVCLFFFFFFPVFSWCFLNPSVSHTQRAFFLLSNPRAPTLGWKRFHSRDLPHAASGKHQQTLRDETRCSTQSCLRGRIHHQRRRQFSSSHFVTGV